MTSKNGKVTVEQAPETTETSVSPISAQALADEIQANVEDLLPLLEKMGLKKATAETIVPEAIAKNARIAVQVRNRIVAPQAPALSAGKEEVKAEEGGQSKAEQPQDEEGGIEIARKLKLSEIKDISKVTGLTQAAVKKLDQALHDRACQLAFMEGFQRQQRQQQQQAAIQTGELTAQLQNIQQRSKELDEQETLLVEEGLSNSNHPIELAKAMGIDLDGIFSKLQDEAEKGAIAGFAHSDVMQRILEGKQVSEEKLTTPFLKLAYQRSQALKNL